MKSKLVVSLFASSMLLLAIIGSFLVEGKPSAVMGRVDKGITHDMSYFLPLALK